MGGTVPTLTQSIADAAAAAGARLVYADNLYAYGPVDGPITEDLPAQATTNKGRIRALMAERLLAAHHSGTLQVAIGRSSDYYGPGGANRVVGDILFGAAVNGRRARWLGRLDVPHSLNYLPDVARALIILGARPEALGEVWHLPAAEPVTGRGFVELIAAALGRPVKVTATSRPALRLAGVFDPRARETIELLYQWERPFVLHASRFQRALGPLGPTPHPGPLPPRSPGSSSEQAAPAADRSGMRRRTGRLRGHPVPALARERMVQRFSGPAATRTERSTARSALPYQRRPGAKAKLNFERLDAFFVPVSSCPTHQLLRTFLLAWSVTTGLAHCRPQRRPRLPVPPGFPRWWGQRAGAEHRRPRAGKQATAARPPWP